MMKNRKTRKTRKIMSKKKSLKCNNKRISFSKKNWSNLRKMKGGGGVSSTLKKEVEKEKKKVEELKEGDIELLEENGKIKELSILSLGYNKTYQLVSDYIEDSDTSYYKGFILGKFKKVMKLMYGSYLIEFENATFDTKYVKQIIIREVEIFTFDSKNDYINLELLRSHTPGMDEGMMEDIRFFYENSSNVSPPGKYTNGGRKKKYIIYNKYNKKIISRKKN